MERRQGALNDGWKNDVTKIGFSSSAPDRQPLEVIHFDGLGQVEDNAGVVLV